MAFQDLFLEQNKAFVVFFFLKRLGLALWFDFHAAIDFVVLVN